MNAPRSIVLHLDSSPSAAQRIRAARLIAETFDGEVSALYCVTPSLLRYPYALESITPVIVDLQRLDDERRAAARATFDEASGGSARLTWSSCEAPWDFLRRSLYADLLVLGQPPGGDVDADDPAVDELPADFIAGLLVDSGRPALIVPRLQAADPTGDTVLIAWKETREAARAVAAALPWLKRARHVHVVSYHTGSAANLDALERQLHTHGVGISQHFGGPQQGDAGELLLSRAADLGADLLVMGCYSHSRAREWILGGATRTILRSMTLPVLMVH